MTLFTSSLNQMAFLVLLILVGYLLSHIGAIDRDADRTLSKLENTVLIPALVFSTFMQRLTVETVRTSWQYLLGGLIVISVSILLALPLSRFFSKERDTRNVYTYALAISNYGFMGNAMVSALFPDLFLHYLIFTLPFQVMTYMWAVPSLLIPSEGERSRLAARLKTLFNPMFVAVLVGAAIGLLAPPIPGFVREAASALGACMSPIAMLLTGITVAKMDFLKLFRMPGVYVATALRLLVIPLAAIFILRFLRIPHPLALCAICSLAMPLGLNTIVIPAAYGKDTTVGASMALISHVLSCMTIPLIFLVFETV